MRLSVRLASIWGGLALVAISTVARFTGHEPTEYASVTYLPRGADPKQDPPDAVYVITDEQARRDGERKRNWTVLIAFGAVVAAIGALGSRRRPTAEEPLRERKSGRTSFIVVGLAIGVYGTASLTGGWLGEPPWWMHEMDGPFGPSPWLAEHGVRPGPGQMARSFQRHRELLSVLTALSGFTLAAFAARPRLRRVTIRQSIRIALVLLGLGGFIYATFGMPDWLWDHFLPADELYMHTNFSPRYYQRLWSGRGIYFEAILFVSGTLAFVGVWPGSRPLRPLRREPLFWVAAAVILLAVLRVLVYALPG